MARSGERGGAVNYFFIPILIAILNYLAPKYTILYKRDYISESLKDRNELKDLGKKELLCQTYGNNILFFKDFAQQLTNVNDYNLFSFAIFSMHKKFLSVQGGIAVIGSYFGGINLILGKKGFEIKRGDYTYYHRFSNATVIHKQSDASFLYVMKHM